MRKEFAAPMPAATPALPALGQGMLTGANTATAQTPQPPITPAPPQGQPATPTQVPPSPGNPALNNLVQMPARLSDDVLAKLIAQQGQNRQLGNTTGGYQVGPTPGMVTKAGVSQDQAAQIVGRSTVNGYDGFANRYGTGEVRVAGQGEQLASKGRIMNDGKDVTAQTMANVAASSSPEKKPSVFPSNANPNPVMVAGAGVAAPTDVLQKNADALAGSAAGGVAGTQPYTDPLRQSEQAVKNAYVTQAAQTKAGYDVNEAAAAEKQRQAQIARNQQTVAAIGIQNLPMTGSEQNPVQAVASAYDSLSKPITPVTMPDSLKSVSSPTSTDGAPKDATLRSSSGGATGTTTAPVNPDDEEAKKRALASRTPLTSL